MLILKRKLQANNLVKISNTNTNKKIQYKNCPKDTANRRPNLLLKSRTNVHLDKNVNNDDATKLAKTKLRLAKMELSL